MKKSFIPKKNKIHSENHSMNTFIKNYGMKGKGNIKRKVVKAK